MLLSSPRLSWHWKTVSGFWKGEVKQQPLSLFWRWASPPVGSYVGTEGSQAPAPPAPVGNSPSPSSAPVPGEPAVGHTHTSKSASPLPITVTLCLKTEADLGSRWSLLGPAAVLLSLPAVGPDDRRLNVRYRGNGHVLTSAPAPTTAWGSVPAPNRLFLSRVVVLLR